MIAIFDYGAGNLRSVANTLDEIGASYTIVRDAAGLNAASKIILPGVGHFGQMVRALDELGVREPIKDRARAGVPLLGICLGLQAMFEGSEEAPDVVGLGLYPGQVRRFPADARVPQMGWNHLNVCSNSRLVRDLPGKPWLYFANSYYVPPMDKTAASGTYSGTTFTAVLENSNVFGVQFHPERSGPVGLQIVRNFIDL